MCAYSCGKKSNEGNVFLKCSSVSTAVQCVSTFNGRFFSGKQISANYVPVTEYNSLFPNSIRAVQVLK